MGDTASSGIVFLVLFTVLLVGLYCWASYYKYMSPQAKVRKAQTKRVAKKQRPPVPVYVPSNKGTPYNLHYTRQATHTQTPFDAEQELEDDPNMPTGLFNLYQAQYEREERLELDKREAPIMYTPCSVGYPDSPFLTTPLFPAKGHLNPRIAQYPKKRNVL